MRHVAEALPLTEPVFFVLLSLAAEPRHGYSLLKNIESLSAGRVRLSTGTLYGALRRLLEDGWIERFQTDDKSRDKQTYRLTAQGLTVLEQESDRLKQLSRLATNTLQTREA